MIDLLDSVARHAPVFDAAWARNLLASVVAAAAVFLLRWFLASRVHAADITSSEMRRRWLVQIRNGCFLLLVAGLAVIWLEELQQLAISVLAVLFALVVATKELIMCLLGSVLKMRAGAFNIGDRIEVSTWKGDVIDQTLLTTQLAELQAAGGALQYSGRTLTLPNSLFLTHPVSRSSDRFVLHTFVVPFPRAADADWAAAEAALLEAAGQVCAPYIEEARAQLSRRSRREGWEGTEVEPRVTLSLVDPQRIDMMLRVASPARQTRRVEQEILRLWLARQPAAPPAPVAAADSD